MAAAKIAATAETAPAAARAFRDSNAHATRNATTEVITRNHVEISALAAIGIAGALTALPSTATIFGTKTTKATSMITSTTSHPTVFAVTVDQSH
jgi:hypothetical protein